MRRFLRGVTHNWQLKLLAVALAVLLWVVVSAEQPTSGWISLPFEVQETDPDFQLLDESVPSEVRVRFSGPGRAFIDLAVRRTPVLLRIGDVDDPEQVFEVGPGMVRLPAGSNLEAFDVEPAFVRLRFRQLATRELPVQLVARQPAGGEWTAVTPLRLRPGTVRVSGPAARVAEVSALRTAPITLPASEEAFERTVELDLTGLEGVELSASRVVLSGRLERVVERRLQGIPVSVGEGIAVRPTEVDVIVRGARSAVAAAASAPLRVVVAIDSIPGQVPPGGVPVPLRVNGLPPGARAVIAPATVQLLPVRMILDSIAVPGAEDDAPDDAAADDEG